MVNYRDWRKFFNFWREFYDWWDICIQKAMHKLIFKHFPNQMCHNTQSFVDFFNGVKAVDEEAPCVLELGGYDGELAQKMLSKFDNIGYWINVELIPIESKCDDQRYHLVVLDKFIWENTDPFVCSVFVSSHTIEHMRFSELKKIFDLMIPNVEYVYLESPINDDVENETWQNYFGTHILEVGWKQITKYLDSIGFNLWFETVDGRGYIKNEQNT